MKGYSLHIGVDNVNKNYYDCEMPLECGSIDAKKFKEFSENTNGFEESILLDNDNNNAKYDNVISELDKMILLSKENTKESFYFFITITCHGFSLSTELGGRDGHLEFLCLEDKMILEHEVREKLAQFESNAKIFIVLTACYAGGIFNEDYIQKEIRGAGRHPTIKKNEEEIFDLIDKYKNRVYSYKSEIGFLASCPKDRVTLKGYFGDPSYFTKWVLYILMNKEYHHNYYELYFLLFECMRNNSTPQFTQRGYLTGFFLTTKPVYFNQQINTNTIKTIDMSWTLNLTFDNTNPNNRLFGDYACPSTYKYVTMIRSTNIADIVYLENSDFDNFQSGDEIRVLLFNKETTHTNQGSVFLKLEAESVPNMQITGHVFLVDISTNTIKDYKKSKKEVSDVIGGKGS